MTITFGSLFSITRTILNNHLEDPYIGTRVGSYFFSEDHEIVFNKYMPKGQVEEDTLTTSDLGFGRPADKTESYRVNVHYFAKHNDLGSGNSSGLKNKSLVSYYVREIRDTIIVHSGSYTGHVLSFDTVEPPLYLRDQQVYVGTLPIIFTTRSSTS